MNIRLNRDLSPIRTNHTLKNRNATQASFAEAMENASASGTDKVSITQKTVSQRLEGVHQRISELDLSGKTSEEAYKAVHDVYEDEFGFFDNVFYTNESMYEVIKADRENMFAEKVPNYNRMSSEKLYYRAMGYDKMTDAEKIQAITKRIGGNTIIDKISSMNELARAGVITQGQQLDLCENIRRNAEMDYCKLQGWDYIEYKHSSKSDMMEKRTMEWAARTSLSWEKIFEDMKENVTMTDEQKYEFFEEFDSTMDLILKNGKEV